MKIMSFNTQHCLNYVTKQVDYEIMAKTILDLGADIVGLNEMFDDCEFAKYGAQTKKLSDLTGFESYYFAKAIDDGDGPYGNGIISKYPFESVETIIIPDPDPKTEEGGYYETRCLLKAKMGNGLTVLITHFGLCKDEQENAVKTVLEHLTEEKCILMGDFNVPPQNELLNPIRERMVDTSYDFCKDKLSFPSDNPRVKIDYIFVSPDIKIKGADIPSVIASDHRPHIAEIEF